MPTNYELLDPSVKPLVLKPNLNVESFFSNVVTTRTNLWVPVPTGELVSEDGVLWFNQRGIVLAAITGVFKTEAGAIGATHIDSSPQKIGFNFVMSGQGEVQWVDVDSPGILEQYEIENYLNPAPDTIYPQPDILDITETWNSADGDAVIKVDSPHRIMGGTVDRYVISLRPDPATIVNKTYEEILAQVMTQGLSAT